MKYRKLIIFTSVLSASIIGLVISREDFQGLDD